MSSLIPLRSLREVQNFCAIKRKTLVIFSAPGCVPCKTLLSIVEQAAAKYPEEIGFAHVEANDTNTDLYSFYNISSVPTIILFSGTDPMAFQMGFKDRESVIKWLTEKLV